MLYAHRAILYQQWGSMRKRYLNMYNFWGHLVMEYMNLFDMTKNSKFSHSSIGLLTISFFEIGLFKGCNPFFVFM